MKEDNVSRLLFNTLVTNKDREKCDGILATAYPEYEQEGRVFKKLMYNVPFDVQYPPIPCKLKIVQ